MNHLRQISVDWADYIRSGHLPRPLVWRALHSTVYPKLRYPLPVLTMTRKECHSISSPLLQAALPAAGICRTFPRVLVHAPLRYQGPGLPDLYTEQGIPHILMVLHHVHHKQDITGQLLRASLEQLTLELGLAGNALLQDFTKFGMLTTPSWITSTWRFLSESNITLHVNSPTFSFQRENDCFLVQAFHHAGIRGQALVAANRCHLFL